MVTPEQWPEQVDAVKRTRRTQVFKRFASANWPPPPELVESVLSLFDLVEKVQSARATQLAAAVDDYHARVRAGETPANAYKLVRASPGYALPPGAKGDGLLDNVLQGRRSNVRQVFASNGAPFPKFKKASVTSRIA